MDPEMSLSDLLYVSRHEDCAHRVLLLKISSQARALLAGLLSVMSECGF